MAILNRLQSLRRRVAGRRARRLPEGLRSGVARRRPPRSSPRGPASRARAAPQPLHAAGRDVAPVEALRGKSLRFHMAGRGNFDIGLDVDCRAAHGDSHRPPRRRGLLQRPDLPSHRAELRDPGRQPRRQRIHAARRSTCATKSASTCRGTVGISTRGRDTGDAQIFVNLIDSPRLDHIYTVFGTVSPAWTWSTAFSKAM